ncbi:MAG: protein disulfide isomerase family protein [Parafilimonas sp.]
MKKLLFLFIIILNINAVHAQDYDTIPPYQKDSLHIPSFTVLNTDSIYISDKIIPKDKPVVIVYFSPECGHCQITADEFSKRMIDMKDIYFVWVSYYYPLSEVKEFAKKFNLQQFNNILIGKLSDYSLPSYYRIKFTPFMAVYNKEHHLIKTYQQGTEADTLISLLKEQ